MVGGYEISLVIPAGTPPSLVEEYGDFIREKERAVDEEWGGRPVSERRDHLALADPTATRRFLTRWLEPDLLALVDEDRIDALFEPTDDLDPVIYDREKIATLLEIFQDAKGAFVAQSTKQMPELWYEGTYIALLEFARDHEDCGVSITM